MGIGMYLHLDIGMDIRQGFGMRILEEHPPPPHSKKKYNLEKKSTLSYQDPTL